MRLTCGNQSRKQAQQPVHALSGAGAKARIRRTGPGEVGTPRVYAFASQICMCSGVVMGLLLTGCADTYKDPNGSVTDDPQTTGSESTTQPEVTGNTTGDIATTEASGGSGGEGTTEGPTGSSTGQTETTTDTQTDTTSTCAEACVATSEVCLGLCEAAKTTCDAACLPMMPECLEECGQTELACAMVCEDELATCVGDC